MTGSRIFHIIGPPGTGKTTTLSRQAARAAEAYGAHDVVVASLTRAAASEVAGRDHGIPDGNVGTLHAHAYRALGHPELAETPEGIRAWNDAHPAAPLSARAERDALEDAPTDADQRPTDDHHARAHSTMMLLRARETPRELWPADVLAHAREWEDFKTQTGRLDFADLIEQAADQGPHPDSPRGLFLDEAQDFSALEMRLARAWAAGTETTVMVGDPDQNLYAWRGADPHALAGDGLAGTRVLAQSYRVPAAVHAVATRWVQRIENRAPVAYDPRDADGAVDRLGATLNTPAAIVEEAEDGDTMVLAACGYMLAPLIAALRADGVPFHNPYRATHGGWNPLRAAHRLAAYLRADERVWGERARCWTWRDLKDWTEPLDARKALARGAKTLIESKCEVDRFGETRADTEVPTETLAEILDSPNLDHPALRLDVDWWAEHLRATKRKVHEYPLAVHKRRGGRALVDTPRLVVGTVHSVKGGENSRVILAPDLSRLGYWNGWHAGGPARDAIIRLLYVGMTRARDRLTLLAPTSPQHVPLELLAPDLAVTA